MTAAIQKDFADWLSPVVVKELRRGLSSGGFVFSLLLIQASMCASIALGFMDAASGIVPAAAGSSWDGIFRLLNIMIFLVVIPVQAGATLAAEIRNSNIELLFLTHLTPEAIVTGKWQAGFIQSVLVAISMVPYTVLRYFMGGVEILKDLFELGVLLFMSAMAGGLFIAVSSYQSRIIRMCILGIAGTIAAFVTVLLAMGGLLGFVFAVAFGPSFLLIMRVIATARISPYMGAYGMTSSAGQNYEY